ncbi:ABC transporter ATP-binding protein, partial [bacterium]|nr:ABC transporter ATP-binding protein [bacterium]
ALDAFDQHATVVRAVEDFSVGISRGEFVAIMGPSGSGKSTLLYVVGAMDKPTGGSLEISGKLLHKMTDTERSRFRNATLGFVFQSFHLLPRMNLLRNVELPMVYSGVLPGLRENRARALLSAVGLSEKAGSLPAELSGGQCQRAAIVRALANNPCLLLADEPTGNLDSKTGLEMMSIFQALNSRGMTILMVTHDETMARHSSRILRLRDGTLLSDEKVEKPLQTKQPEGIDIPSIIGSPDKIIL